MAVLAIVMRMKVKAATVVKGDSGGVLGLQRKGYEGPTVIHTDPCI